MTPRQQRAQIRERTERSKATARKRSVILNGPSSRKKAPALSSTDFRKTTDWRELLGALEIGQVKRFTKNPHTPCQNWGDKLGRKFHCERQDDIWVVERLS